jgi:hypothetical protein
MIGVVEAQQARQQTSCRLRHAAKHNEVLHHAPAILQGATEQATGMSEGEAKGKAKGKAEELKGRAKGTAAEAEGKAKEVGSRPPALAECTYLGAAKRWHCCGYCLDGRGAGHASKQPVALNAVRS